MLAEILLAFGDPNGAFDINKELYEEDLKFSIFDFVRAIKGRQQANHAAEIMSNTSEMWGELNETEWSTFFSKILLDLVYSWDGDSGVDDRSKMEVAIRSIVIQDHERRDHLKQLHSRGLPFDVPVYLVLDAALRRTGRGSAEDQDRILKQFIDQQPAFSGGSQDIQTALLHIDCLPLCLKWCTEMLRRGEQYFPAETPGNGPEGIAGAYEVLSLLWRNMMLGLMPGNLPRGSSLAWAHRAEEQLGISATELLAAVVCMIMAAALDKETALRGPRPLDRARTGAHLLYLAHKDLVWRFLHQVREANKLLVAPPEEELIYHPSRVDLAAGDAAEKIVPFREFAASQLEISDKLPSFCEGTTVIPLALARYPPEDADEGTHGFNYGGGRMGWT